jgi:hypothetical protein
MKPSSRREAMNTSSKHQLDKRKLHAFPREAALAMIGPRAGEMDRQQK